MKKMKSLKFLALTAIFGALSMNAYADDESDRSVNGIKYKLVTKYKADGKTVDSRTATVQAVNTEATADQKKTIVVPATVNGDNNVEYKVTGFASSTWGANAADKCTSLTINVDNFPDALTSDAFGGFTKLENLVINDGGSLGKTKVFPTGVSKTIKTVDFSNSKIEEIAESAFEGCNALTSCPLDGIKKIGANAFNGTVITELTIPNTVESIGENAFANMYYQDPKTKAESGLKKLTFNAGDKIGETIPAAFAGDALLESVTITSAKAKSITAGAFTGDNDIHWIDLGGMTALETAPTDAFDATLRLFSLKLAGTKLKEVAPSLAYSNRTLGEITFPAEITAATLPSFKNFVALKAIDLSGTKVTEIPDGAFCITDETEVFYGGRQACEMKKDGSAVEKWTYAPWGDPVFIEPVLATVTLNAKTTKIGASAFSGQTALATVANLNQGDLTEIGGYAFSDANLSALDLSGAAKLTTIGEFAFAENSNMATVALPASITTLGAGVFCYDNQIASINLGDLKKLATLPCLFQAGVSDEAEGKGYMDKLTTVTLPMDGALTTIKDGALQLLAIEEIVIPSTVTSFGWGVTQGCINLKKFTWEDAQVTRLDDWTFRGDDKLETVIFATTKPITSTWDVFDTWFYGNDKDVLTVYVTDESYELLEANGWSEANAKYATLAKIGPAEYDFTEKALAADGYYYRTYVNEKSATWFDANEVEVFGAVVEGANVVLKPAEVENGFYKVMPYYTTSTYEEWDDTEGKWRYVTHTYSHPSQALCVIRSKTQKVNIQLKDLGANQISTLKENDLKYVTDKDGMQVSRLRYMYKLGRKDDQVKFWRCTSGKLNKGVIYLNSNGSKDLEFMDMIVEGEATAIKGFQAEAQDANAPIYTLQGVRVNKAQKGIYIQNGKKFIMK